jgi:hypothetical protein
MTRVQSAIGDADATDASMSDLRQTMRAAGRVVARLIARAGKTSQLHALEPWGGQS